jgi:hypothetical protein
MRRSTFLPLSASVVLLFSQTACSADQPKIEQPPSTLGWTSPVSPPATPPGSGVPCVDADKADEQGLTVGGVKAGPFGKLLREQRGGVAKLWVAQDPAAAPADALIRIEHVESRTVAYYVRDAAATSSPLGDDGKPSRDKIYPGSILLPPDGHLRITVTIGRATGCFAYAL